ncbi:MAG: hypothetical protein K2M00_00020, partial [Muribaculaceae bacterium]|nr:hypothetical protein [Muribaculaceae bacterium]
MKIKSLIIAAIVIAAGFTRADAQNGTISPYSRYGYGLLSDHATSAQTSMGGVGYAMHSGRQINVMNPASYARVDSLTFLFDMGVDLTALWTSENFDGKKVSGNNFGGGLSYITMQFPVSKRIGMSAGLLPWSSVGYSFGNGIDNGYSSRSGDGSINELYVGIGGRIAGGLSIGLNASYLFGSTNNYTYVTADNASVSLYRREISVRDWHINAGLQYVQPIGNDVLALGVTYSPAKEFLGHARTFVQNIDTDKSPVQVESNHMRDGYSMAASYGAGISYTRDSRLFLEADFTYQPWSKEKYDGVTGVLADRYKIALGGSLRPALRGSYMRRVEYRAGLFYDRDYLVINGNHVREFGASVGLGFPVPGYKTVINLGLQWLHRQATPNALVKEDYLNNTLGI